MTVGIYFREVFGVDLFPFLRPEEQEGGLGGGHELVNLPIQSGCGLGCVEDIRSVKVAWDQLDTHEHVRGPLLTACVRSLAVRYWG